MANREDTIKTKLAIDGEKEYREACKGINSSLREIGSEMNLVTATYADNANSTKALTQKQDILKKTLSEQTKKVEEAEKALATMRKNGVDPASPAYQKMQTNLNNAKAEMAKTENQIKSTTKELQSSKVNWESVGNVVGKVGKAFGTALAALGGAAVGAATALTGLTVSASNYADDLITQSTFTRQSTDELQKYAYAARFIDVEMDTLTKSMAKNIKSMDSARNGSEAYADAYKALGISVVDANGKLRDSNDVYWETIDALGNVQNETERDALAMQLFGKSAQELNSVIGAGSEAFKRLGDEAAQMGFVLSEDAVTRLGAFNDKLQVLSAGMDGLKNAASLIALPFLDTLAAEGIPILTDFSSAVMAAEGDVSKMASALGDGIAAVLNLITDKLPEFAQMGVDMLMALVSGLVSSAPGIAESATQIVTTLVMALAELLPMLIDGAVQLVAALASGIDAALPELLPAAVQMIAEIITGLIDAIPMLVEAADDIILGLADGLLAALPDLIAAIPTITLALTSAILDHIPDLIDTGVQLLTALVDNMPGIIDAIVEVIPALTTGIITSIIEHLPEIAEAGVSLFIALISNVDAIIDGVIKIVPVIITGLFGALTDPDNLSKLGEAGIQLLNGLIQGLRDALTSAKDAIVEIFGGIIDWVKELFGIHSPSTVFAGIGDFILQGLGQGLLDGVGAVLDTVASVFGKIWDAIKSIFGFGGESSESKEGKEIGSDIMSGVKSGIENGKDDVEKAGKNAAKAALDAMAAEFGTTDGASTKTQAFGENLVKGINAGLGDVSADDFSGGVGKITEALETAINDALGMQSTGFLGLGGKSSEKFSGVGDNIISAIAEGIEKSKGGSNAVKTAITGVIDEAATAGTESAKTNGIIVGEHIITAIADKIAADVGTITGKIPAMTTTIVAAFDARLPDYIAAGQRIADKLAEGMDGNVAAITGKVDGMTTEIITTYEDQHGRYTDEGTVISNLIAEAMAANVTAITNQIPGMTQDILAALESHHTEYTDEGVQIDESVRTGMANKAGALTNEMNQIMIQIKGVIDGYNGELYACGRNMADGIWSGMRSMRSTLISRVRSMMQDIVAAVKDEMDINSPSKVFAGIGRYMAMGLSEGFSTEMRNTDTLIRRAVDGAVPGVQQYGGRSNNQGTTFAITQNVYANDTSYVEQQRQAAKNFRQIAREIAI